MKHILLPTDFGETSFKAMLFAVDLFGVEDVRYTMLNTYLKPAYRNAMMPVETDTARASGNGLRRMKRRLLHHVPGVQVALRSRIGPLSQAVNDLHAGRTPADLVVMGTQGEGNYGQVGRNTGAVVTGTRAPVITVPSQWHRGRLERIVWADDGLDAGRETVQPLIDIARRAPAHVQVVHVRREDGPDRHKDHRAALRGLLEGVDHSFLSISGADVTAAIDAHAAASRAQLVAMVHRQRSFWERIFKGSTSKRMALHTTVPLLVLQEGA